MLQHIIINDVACELFVRVFLCCKRNQNGGEYSFPIFVVVVASSKSYLRGHASLESEVERKVWLDDETGVIRLLRVGTRDRISANNLLNISGSAVPVTFRRLNAAVLRP